MSAIISIYVERLAGGKYHAVPSPVRESDTRVRDPGGPSTYHLYEWYNGGWGASNRVLVSLLSCWGQYEGEPLTRVDDPGAFSDELASDLAEDYPTVIRLSDLLSYDFDQLISCGDEPEPLRQWASSLLDMLKAVQAAVGTTQPHDVRLLVDILI